jgi:hypothetical protein
VANLPIHDPLDFSTDLRKLETTDPDHADTWNVLYERLINNDAFLKALVDKLMNATEGHTHSGVDGQGPKIPLASLAEAVAKVTDLNAHKNDQNNPHGVTASQVGAVKKAGRGANYDASAADRC